MTSRTRVRDKQVTHEGLAETALLWPPGTSSVERGKSGSYHITDDTVGNWDTDNSFQSNRTFRKCAMLNGTYYSSPGKPYTRLTNVPHYWAGNAVVPPLPYFSLPDFSSEVKGWVGAMQPGLPSLNVPTVVGESADIPRTICQLPMLVRDWGSMVFSRHAGTNRRAKSMAEKARAFGKLANKAARDVGSTHLNAQFGISPTISDALAMLGLLREVLSTYELLARLAKGRSIKRSLRLTPRREVQELGNKITHSGFVTVTCNNVRVYTEKSWVTTRWEPLLPAALVSPKSPKELMDEAIRITTGLSASGLALAWWELLPWSWLVDWIAEIQDQLELLLGNAMLLKCVSICYCRTSTMDDYYSVVSKPTWLSVDGEDRMSRVLKERYPLTYESAPEPAPALPAFNGRQLGILAALAASRR